MEFPFKAKQFIILPGSSANEKWLPIIDKVIILHAEFPYWRILSKPIESFGSMTELPAGYRRRTCSQVAQKRSDTRRPFWLQAFIPRRFATGASMKETWLKGNRRKSPLIPLYERGKPSMSPPLYKGETEGIFHGI
jgi:hypothetical protein